MKGGKREGAGRKAMANKETKMLVAQTKHWKKLDVYKRRNKLASRSEAFRHLIETRAGK